jgi:hypothetical protein
LGGSAGHTQQQNSHQSARNILKSVDHRLPPDGYSFSRRLAVDGVDNKANMRFCRLACWYSLPQSRCSVWIHSRPREVGFTFDADRVHITPDVGAISPRAPRGK